MIRMFHIQPNTTGGRPPEAGHIPHSQTLQRSVFIPRTHQTDPEPNWYIYHSDHLGSSAFLTDANGTPTQHPKSRSIFCSVLQERARSKTDYKKRIGMQYMPFGESFIEQRSITSYYTPYTFSAKERDTETGYSYFGARYYDADISVWLSVDPMAGLFPSHSSFQYVGSNPVGRIDHWGLYGDPVSATNDRQRAAKQYGDHRVGEVFNRGSAENPDYRFHIYKKNQHKFEMSTTSGSPGVRAYRPEASIGSTTDFDAYLQTGGGAGWATYLSMGASIMSEMYYSKFYGTWMGRNFKLYSHCWGGNGFTGGKNKFAKKTSNKIKWGGRILGLYGLYNIGNQMIDEEISMEWAMVEGSVNIVSSYAGPIGAAFGLGWEAGRLITQIPAYQEAKFNYWHNRMEKHYGPPSMYNEHLWAEFYKNYGL